MAISPPRSQWRFDLRQTGIEPVRACWEARRRWLEAGFSDDAVRGGPAFHEGRVRNRGRASHHGAFALI
jgi:hypothetical protein